MAMPLNQFFPQFLKNYYHALMAVLAVIRFGYPARNITVIGVTGTDGKTTTASLICHLLQSAGYRAALISTVGAYINGQLYDIGFHVTSPDPWLLQRLIRRAAAAGVRYLVLEATSHGLDQYRLFGTNISYAAITNVTDNEHLDYHRTFDRYIRAKAKIFRTAKLAVLNRDDLAFARLGSQVPESCQILPYSLKAVHPLMSNIKKKFIEPYNQANALAAVTLVTALGLSQSQVKPGLASFPGIPGRLQVVPNRRGLRLIVDFAHTPNGLRQSLTALKSASDGKLIAVYGSAGLRDRAKRLLLGKIGADLADEVILTAEDPRTESVKTIIHQMLEGVTQHRGHVHAITDRGQAISFAIRVLAKPGDTVAVLGKGHETSINLDGRRELPWSDAKAVIQSL